MDTNGHTEHTDTHGDSMERELLADLISLQEDYDFARQEQTILIQRYERLQHEVADLEKEIRWAREENQALRNLLDAARRDKQTKAGPQTLCI